MLCVLRIFQRRIPHMRVLVNAIRFHKTTISTIGSAYASSFITKSDDNTSEPGNAATLNHKYLIKNAAIACVDSASALLTQTTSNLLELEEQYARALAKLSRLFEMSTEHLESEQRQTLIWDAIVEVRHEVTTLREQREEMASLYYAAERMLHAAAEAALTAGAEYASVAAGERVFSAQSRLSSFQGIRADAEARATKVEAEYIYKSSEHYKNERRKQDLDKIDSEEETNDNEQNVTSSDAKPGETTKDEEREFTFYPESETFKEEESVGD